MINLNNVSWKQFKVKDLFTIHGGKDYPSKDQSNGNIPFIGSSSVNNGVVNFLAKKSNTPKSIFSNVLSVNRTGSVGYCFYHSYTAYFQGRVRVLLSSHLNKYTALFLCTCIRQQRHQFSYGFGLGTNHLKEMKINLPIDSNNHPNWKFMELYIKSILNNIPKSRIHNKIHHSSYSLNSMKWKSFQIKNIGSIKSSHDYPKKSRISGLIPFIGSSNTNNGITDYIKSNNNAPKAFYSHVISVNRNGSVGYAFYHPTTAYFSGDVRVLSIHKLNFFSALFIVTCVRQQRHQFSFGFKLGKERLKNLKINLPVSKDGNPNWQFMTNYIKSMMK